MIRLFLSFLIVLFCQESTLGQSGSIEKLRSELEKAPDPVAYLKTKKKKFRVDTIVITNNKRFYKLHDSIAYYGKIKKVYGPWPEDSVLLQVTGKAPNMFYRASHILLDTPRLKTSVARALADTITARIRRKESSFEDMARVYNTDGSGPEGGDLGWRARGTLIPVMENAILKRKKGDIVRVWSPYGLHIIRVSGTPVKDTGFVLLLNIKI